MLSVSVTSALGEQLAQTYLRVVQLPRGAPSESPAEAQINLRPYPIFTCLVAISILLAVADLISLALDQSIGSVQIREVFNVDEEQSIPTWFSTIQLFAAHLLLLLIAWVQSHHRSRFAGYWWFLSAMLLALSVDEVAGIHDSGSLVLTSLGVGGDWVIVGGALAGAVGLVYIRFLMALPRRVAALFVVGGALLMAGALGIEMLHLTYAGTEETFRSGLVGGTEEFLERLGISVFILGLLVYMREHLGLQGLGLK